MPLLSNTKWSRKNNHLNLSFRFANTCFSLFRNKIKDIALLDSMGKLSVQEDFACGYDLPFNEHPRVLCYGCFGFENIGLYKIVLPALHSAGKAQQTNKTFLI